MTVRLSSLTVIRYNQIMLSEQNHHSMKELRQPEAQVGRPAKISREDIADTALRLGLDSVKLKAIATHLGVDHSSLYRHVKNRDDIIYAALERAISTLDWEANISDWQTYLKSLGDSLWSLYGRYQGLAVTIRASKCTPPTIVETFSKACSQLETYGFSLEDAALIVDSIVDMTTDSALIWQQLESPDKDGKRAIERLSHSWQTAKNIHTAKHVEYIVSVITGDPKQWWNKKLMLLIAGAETLLTSPERAGLE